MIFGAAFAAGIINSIAGGGTLISFPALLWIGTNAIIANATSTVALWPGSFSGMIGFRHDLAKVRRWLFLLTIPSLAGGALGAILLLASQEVVTKRLNLVARAHENPTAGWVTFVFLFQFMVGIYGGYFGAGIGILMLAALGLIGLTDMHQMNGLKNLLAICINGVAALYFAASGAVIWFDAVLMAVAAIVGGFTGAKLAHKLGRKFVRGAVVVIGLSMTIALFLRR